MVGVLSVINRASYQPFWLKRKIKEASLCIPEIVIRVFNRKRLDLFSFFYSKHVWWVEGEEGKSCILFIQSGWVAGKCTCRAYVNA